MSHFRTAIFRMDGRVSDVFPADVNRDGRRDFIAVRHVLSPEGIRIERFLSVFIQKANGFSMKADQDLVLDQGEVFFQLADTDRDSLPELVFLTMDGVYRKTWLNDSGFSGWAPLVRDRSLFSRPDAEKVVPQPFVLDLEGDGFLELSIPQAGGLDVYRPNADGEYVWTCQLCVLPRGVLEETLGLSYSIRMPRLIIRDFNADGVPDLFFVQGNRLDLFIQHRGPSYGSAGRVPPDFRFQIGGYDETGDAKDKPASVLEVEDVNGDGRADVIEASHSRILRIHYNRLGRFDPIPDRVLLAEDVSFGYVLRDLNRDGLVDPAFIELSTGLRSLTQFLSSQNYQRVLKCYFSRRDSAFSRQPDFQLAFKQKFRIQDPTGKNAFLSLDGDFTGDGIADMAVGSTPNTIEIFPGLYNGVFEKKAAGTIHTTVSNAFRMEDMNADGVSDLFFWYPNDTGLAGQLVLLLSE